MAILKTVQFWAGLGLALAVAGAIFFIYERGVHAGKAACEGRHAVARARAIEDQRRMERLAQDVGDKVGARVTAAISEIQPVNRTNTRIIRHDVEKVPVYTECLLTDGVFDALNRLRGATRAGPEPGPAPGLPGPAGPAGQENGHAGGQ